MICPNCNAEINELHMPSPPNDKVLGIDVPVSHSHLIVQISDSSKRLPGHMSEKLREGRT